MFVKLLTGTVMLVGVLLATSASAVTVYYQPQPLPDKGWQGDPLPINDLPLAHSLGGYVTSANRTAALIRNDRLVVSGGYQAATALFKFDLTGLPRKVRSAMLWLYAFPRPGEVPVPAIFVCRVLKAWDSTLTWAAHLSGTWEDPYDCVRYDDPPAEGWIGIDLKALGWYDIWVNDSTQNNGIIFYPNEAYQAVSQFYSSRYRDYANDPIADAKRPTLALTYVKKKDLPELKLPLPGNARWLPSTETGGSDCRGEAPFPDKAHQKGGYTSIDFLPTNKKPGSGAEADVARYTGPIPVLAAADGVVAVASKNRFNGNYVVLNHNDSTDQNVGLTTWYLHLADPAPVFTVGQSVRAGDQLGIMGTTGESSGVHLHFGVRWNGKGGSGVAKLGYVLMEGLLLKSYQTDCEVNTSGWATKRIRYYTSTNRVY